jgi:SWI/SNF-related matrix-associated actin-dependent regulator of chromatin subfamily A-like protein 1
MPTPMPHQIEGAKFLASRNAALLADEPRVGKTGAAITACDFIFARKILVVTKSSARGQWGREFREWGFPRKIQVIYSGKDKVDPSADVVIVGWGMVFDHRLLNALLVPWDVMILDESHEAKNPQSKRTQAVFNKLELYAKRTWCLTGTPIPNAPNDLYPMLSALRPSEFKESYAEFMKRYCVVRKKYVGGQWIEYAIKGRNEDELRERLAGFWLRRTQEEVGIQPPIYSVFALTIAKLVGDLDVDAAAVLEAAEAGDSRALEMHLGQIRRVTGLVKARAVIEAAKEFLDGSPGEKLVLMAWHTDVVDALKAGLSEYGAVCLDGRTTPTTRDEIVQSFKVAPSVRIFIGQILAAGEAIDLSTAAELWFVEPSFTPKDMKQAALRITNHNQKRQAIVKVCALEGSIDEALMEILTRKVASIKLIMEK